MPNVFLSPSTQEWNPYVNGGSEEFYMNQIADRMEPYCVPAAFPTPETTQTAMQPERLQIPTLAAMTCILPYTAMLHRKTYPESCVGLIFTMPPAVASARFLQTFLLTA